MTRASGRGAALIAAVVAMMALLLGGTASANGGIDRGPWPANDCDAGRAAGDGSFIAATFKFTVCANHNDPHDVAGYFQAVGNFGSGVLIAPQGPVTCAVFRGNTVSFLYPLVNGSRPVSGGTTAILIVATDGGASGDKIGFIGPAPTAAFGNNCDFQSLPSTVGQLDQTPLTSGSIEVTSRKS